MPTCRGILHFMRLHSHTGFLPCHGMLPVHTYVTIMFTGISVKPVHFWGIKRKNAIIPLLLPSVFYPILFLCLDNKIMEPEYQQATHERP